MADDESRAERVDDVLIVRVEHEAINDLACIPVSTGLGSAERVLLTLEADDGL